jgi:hypothetical protein
MCGALVTAIPLGLLLQCICWFRSSCPLRNVDEWKHFRCERQMICCLLLLYVNKIKLFDLTGGGEPYIFSASPTRMLEIISMIFLEL